MTLRTRLFLAALALSLASTFAVALVVRTAWKQSETQRFERQFQAAVEQLSTSLAEESTRLTLLLDPLCEHDPIVDSALLGTVSGTLDSRLLSLRARLPELSAALKLDELALIASDGTVLAGETRLSAQGRALRQHVLSRLDSPGFRASAPEAFEAACIKRDGDIWVALLGATQLSSRLKQAGQAHDLTLALEPPGGGNVESDDFRAQLPLEFLNDSLLVARRSKAPFRASLRRLDLKIAGAALLTLLAALVLAYLLTRGLARPLVSFAQRTREAVTGKVSELPISGGPELEQAARAFNATLRDLRDLRTRLAKVEKIAAQREVARQVAHEIKNPLSPLRTSLETLRKIHARGHPDFDRLFEETSQVMLQEVQRLTALVAHFSEYAKLPSPQLSEVDLSRLLEEVVSLHKQLGATLEIRTEQLPPVRADRNQIAQVLTNLIKNSLEATKEVSQPRVLISLVAQAGHPEVQCLTVTDNGPGVQQEDLERLFEPYVTTKVEGTGLGLPISQRIAVEHGGDLAYRTAEGGGAQFELSLPRFGPPELPDT